MIFMKKKIIVLFFFSILFKQGNASCMFFLRLISDKGDTTDIYVSDIVRFDTANNLLVLSSQASEKIEKQSFSKGRAILNNEGQFINVHIYEAVSSNYEGDPSVTISKGNIFFYDKKTLVISGEIWKKIAIINNIPIKKY